MGENGTIYTVMDFSLRAMMSDGETLWKWASKDYSSIKAGIAPDGTLRVFSASSVVSLNPDGTERWNLSVPGLNPLIASLLIDGNGTVYGAIDDRSKPALSGVVAIDSSGTLKWKFNAEGQASRGMGISDDGILVFASSSYEDSANRLYAVYPNGTMRWERDIAHNWMGTDLSIGQDGTIYVQESDNSMLALDPNGTLLWSYRGTNTYRPAAVENQSIITANDTRLICLNADGTERWQYDAEEKVYNFLLTRSGSVLFTTSTRLGYVLSNGALDFSVDILHPTDDLDAAVYNPIIGEDGSIFVLSFNEYGTYLVHVSQPIVRSDVMATAWEFTIIYVVAIAAAISASALLIIRLSSNLRRKEKDRVLHPGLLWVSIGLRITGVIIAFIALASTWRFVDPVQSGFYLDPVYGVEGWEEYAPSRQYIDLFFWCALISFVTWAGAYLGLAALLSYSAFLVDESQRGVLAWQADLSMGLPYGDGFIIAWAVILILFVSGILRLLATTSVWKPVYWGVSED